MAIRGSVQIGPIGEENSKAAREKTLKKDLENERMVAFNACGMLKMEIDFVGDFFFGSKDKEEENDMKKSKSGLKSSEHSYSSDSSSEEEDDYQLSKFYQSNTREELANQLKAINFEEESNEADLGMMQDEDKEEDLSAEEDLGEAGTNVDKFLKELMDSNDPGKEKRERKNSKNLEKTKKRGETIDTEMQEDIDEFKEESNALIDQYLSEDCKDKEDKEDAEDVNPNMFGSGNALDLDFAAILSGGLAKPVSDLEPDSSIEQIQKKIKQEIEGDNDWAQMEMEINNLDLESDLLEKEDEDYKAIIGDSDFGDMEADEGNDAFITDMKGIEGTDEPELQNDYAVGEPEPNLAEDDTSNDFFERFMSGIGLESSSNKRKASDGKILRPYEYLNVINKWGTTNFGRLKASILIVEGCAIKHWNDKNSKNISSHLIPCP